MKIFYSIRNGGDGSAYPIFFDSKELAIFDQDNLDEGWGESCDGELIIQGDNLIIKDAKDKYWYLYSLIDQFDWKDELYKYEIELIKKFINEFFSEGLPEYEVKIIDDTWIGIYYENSLIDRTTAYPDEKTSENTVKKESDRIIKTLEKFKNL